MRMLREAKAKLYLLSDARIIADLLSLARNYGRYKPPGIRRRLSTEVFAFLRLALSRLATAIAFNVLRNRD